jgi:hypothetical protein
MDQEQNTPRRNAWRCLIVGIVLIAVSLCSWPFLYVFAALTMLNNHDATNSEWALAYVCIFGPGVGVAIGLTACIYAIVLRKRCS